MTNFFDFNNKLQRALDNYSKTTETMFKYQQKVMDRQYNTLLEVIKTVNSIDYGVDTLATEKPVKKAAAKPVAPKPVTKPVAKETAKPVAPKPVTKPAEKAPIKKEATKPVVQKTVATPVAAKPIAKHAAAKAPVKQEALKPIAKTPAKPAVKAPAKKAAPKNASQDRLAALKAATQQAVKTNQNVKK